MTEIKTKSPVPDFLHSLASIYEQRNSIYGDNYKKFGRIMSTILGERTFQSAEDFNRFGIFVQMISKITRYAENYDRGGHEDSLDDLCVYAMMLKELDSESTMTRLKKSLDDLKAETAAMSAEARVEAVEKERGK